MKRYSMPVTFVETVQGETVSLPCNLSSANKEDKVVLVWWAKDDGTSIYREFPTVICTAGHSRGHSYDLLQKWKQVQKVAQSCDPLKILLKHLAFFLDVEYAPRDILVGSPLTNIHAYIDLSLRKKEHSLDKQILKKKF
ncbi:hypothetical protein ABEB36_002984 [Hypothenemus hampei]|uniref:Uncharacterized protein n=1 Tax=Hypothenemus hampei TaxID=57062 RepID=A0ABD1FA96_HYPHA